ncbi:MAG: hypothetical protein ACRELA_00030 [Candidatus Rokuibacteriota bacterium]
MAELKVGDLRSVVDAVRRVVSEWDAFVGGVEGLARENEDRQAALARLEREHGELRETHERLRRELEAATRALTELRSAHEALLREHEGTRHTLNELRDRHGALLQDRQFASDQLESVLRRMKA